MVEPFSVDSQLSMIVILSRAVGLCQVKGYTGGIPLECLEESAVTISKIKNSLRVTEKYREVQRSTEGYREVQLL